MSATKPLLIQTQVYLHLLMKKSRIHAACFLNNALLKGYTGKVLRVRHLILSPYYDFEDLEIEDYAGVLGSYLLALIECSEKELISKHLKIHYRSPYDRTFFATFAMAMRTTGRLPAIESKGMWLHLTKCKPFSVNKEYS
jgi:hypothetical protein